MTENPLIGVVGHWHLGTVTAAGVAELGYRVIGFDRDPQIIAGLNHDSAPIHEPGLNDLIAQQRAAGRLDFSDDPQSIENADLVWICYDTPVDDNDEADTQSVIRWIEELFPHVKDNSCLLISSQLPAGTTRLLADRFSTRYPNRQVSFGYSPENLRLGSALKVFRQQERLVVGLSDHRPRAMLEKLLSPITMKLVWTSIESAEMVKHAVNAFLAVSVTYANELAKICEKVGADAAEVEAAIRLEPRIGQKAYIRPGASFAGGTLARDIRYLTQFGNQFGVPVPLFDAVSPSNEAHKLWPLTVLEENGLQSGSKIVTLLGLTYKPGTSSARRSTALLLSEKLIKLGCMVRAFDPLVDPNELVGRGIDLRSEVRSALEGVSAAIVTTEWPEFQEIAPSLFKEIMARPLVIDPSGFLKQLQGQPEIFWRVLGRKI